MSSTPDITLAAVVARNHAPLAADVGERVVLMSAERGNYYDLDETGSEIWRRIAQPVRVSDLCAQLLATYDAPREALEADVLAFLQRLASQGLIDVSAG